MQSCWLRRFSLASPTLHWAFLSRGCNQAYDRERSMQGSTTHGLRLAPMRDSWRVSSRVDSSELLGCSSSILGNLNSEASNNLGFNFLRRYYGI